MSSLLSSLSKFLYALSRIPGLAFLSKLAQSVDQTISTKQNLDAAARAAKEMTGKK